MEYLVHAQNSRRCIEYQAMDGILGACMHRIPGKFIEYQADVWNINSNNYRNNNSTEQALVNVTQKIYKSTDKGKICLLVLLDLSNAFDRVNPDLLLNKLAQLTIDSRWFASYLHDRTQSVKIDKIIVVMV